jgi:hypothetical protein
VIRVESLPDGMAFRTAHWRAHRVHIAQGPTARGLCGVGCKTGAHIRGPVLVAPDGPLCKRCAEKLPDWMPL